MADKTEISERLRLADSRRVDEEDKAVRAFLDLVAHLIARAHLGRLKEDASESEADSGH
jgi:hypothetical protein